MAAFVVLKLCWTAVFCSAPDIPAVLSHGLSMDACVAGYCAALPVLMMIALVWCRGVAFKFVKSVINVILLIVAVLAATVFVADFALYPYWHCRLDSTAVFYALGWPRQALASVKLLQGWAGVFGIIMLASGLYAGARAVLLRGLEDKCKRRVSTTFLMLLWAAILFIFIRGGLTVSTMNPGRVYFSERAELNHAALNPVFTLMHSLTHGDDYGNRYRFMSDDEASALMPVCTEDTIHSLTHPRTDIYLIILESFSAHLLPCMGGDSVAMRLDGLARMGVLFDGVYASSFRTDRALPAILNGTPAQPSTSVIKFTSKTAKLPSVARSLAREGYRTEYYYGGDADFTNMRALLVNSGFGTIVSDTDFPLAQRASKWGVNDGDLFRRALEDLPSDGAPVFRVIQTSSSHEPFDVPYADARFADSPQRNAFAYADSCLGAFVDGVMANGRGRDALFVIIPDHQGAWPDGVTDMAARHHIPMVFYGSHLSEQGITISTPASQNDLAATLLGVLAVEHDDFPFSSDIIGCRPARAYFTEPSSVAIVTEGDTIVYDPDGDTVLQGNAALKAEAQAWLRNLYKYLESL